MIIKELTHLNLLYFFFICLQQFNTLVISITCIKLNEVVTVLQLFLYEIKKHMIKVQRTKKLK